MNTRHFGKFKSPEEAVADVKTQRSAVSRREKCEQLLRKHRYALQKEQEAIANYERRIELLKQMEPDLPR